MTWTPEERERREREEWLVPPGPSVLAERLDRIRDLHGPVELREHGQRCRVCRQENGALMPWPCLTYRLANDEDVDQVASR